jgi:tetratricopeptide (TPR) repeat protein
MNLKPRIRVLAFLSIGLLSAIAAGGQDFGTAKERLTLERQLPALVHLTGTTFKVKATGHADQAELVQDLQSLLETELLKDDPQLRADQRNPSALVTCQIIAYSHPPPTESTKPGLAVSMGAAMNQSYKRVTGSLSIAFQARSATGQVLGSDNVIAKYDEEFDGFGNSASQGVKGTVTTTWKRIKGGTSSEALNPPTDAELQSLLMADAVRQIAEHIVNTKEAVDVYLAQKKGALDSGDKLAETGLWQRALETFETAPPFPKREDDAYRLYNIGVAYEALAYQAEDEKSAMNYLDQAAINYGKAIDDKPTERYFLQPQKRIETAIQHYKELEDQQSRRPVPTTIKIESTAGKSGAGSKAGASASALTNAKVIAMVKSGVDDDTVAQTIRASKAVNFDLSADGLQGLTDGGVSAQVLTAMKTRAARRPVAAK